MGRKRIAGNDLPRRMHQSRGVYYFVTPVIHKWVNIGRDRALAEEKMKALSKAFPTDIYYTNETGEERTQLETMAKKMYNHARGGAKKRGLEWKIERIDILEKLIESKNRCALSGIEFNYSPHGKRGARPWMPSIDRINSRLGYIKNNIRVVCLVTNIALSDFGEDVLKKLAKGISENCQISMELLKPSESTNQ